MNDSAVQCADAAAVVDAVHHFPPSVTAASGWEIWGGMMQAA